MDTAQKSLASVTNSDCGPLPGPVLWWSYRIWIFAEPFSNRMQWNAMEHNVEHWNIMELLRVWDGIETGMFVWGLHNSWCRCQARAGDWKSSGMCPYCPSKMQWQNHSQTSQTIQTSTLEEDWRALVIWEYASGNSHAFTPHLCCSMFLCCHTEGSSAQQ